MIRKQKPIYDYDRKNDILYVDLIYPSAAYSEEIDDNIFLRIDPKNDQVVGLTVFALKEKTEKNFKVVSDLGIDWNEFLEMV